MRALRRLDNITAIWHARDKHRQPLLHGVSGMHWFQSSDPRDKIYALLGVSSEGLGFEEHPRLRIDYGPDRKVVDVYCDAVRYLLENPNPSAGRNYCLGVLSLVQQEERVCLTEGWPSWVPRWDRRDRRGPGWALSFQSHAKLKFSASKGMSVLLEDTGDQHVLAIKGLCVDEVKHVFSCLPNHNYSRMWVAVECWWQRISQEGQIKKGYENAERYLSEVLVAGSTIDILGQDETSFTEHVFATYWQHNTELEAKCIPKPKEKSVQREISGPCVAPSSIESGVATQNQILRQKQFALFVTKSGGFGVGLGVESGDKVCILYGGIIPFILRKVGGHHQLIGECYVAGLMKGEAIDERDAGRLKEEVFLLR